MTLIRINENQYSCANMAFPRDVMSISVCTDCTDKTRNYGSKTSDEIQNDPAIFGGGPQGVCIQLARSRGVARSIYGRERFQTDRSDRGGNGQKWQL